MCPHSTLVFYPEVVGLYPTLHQKGGKSFTSISFWNPPHVLYYGLSYRGDGETPFLFSSQMFPFLKSNRTACASIPHMR